jgi:hypothetical protein
MPYTIEDADDARDTIRIISALKSEVSAKVEAGTTADGIIALIDKQTKGLCVAPMDYDPAIRDIRQVYERPIDAQAAEAIDDILAEMLDSTERDAERIIARAPAYDEAAEHGTYRVIGGRAA